MTNILEYLENSVAHHRDKLAFASGEMEMTFGELYEKARAIGTEICKLSIYKRPIVVFMEKCPNMIAAFLGVTYSGNYYVPLDSEIPAFRIQLILQAVNPALIICDETTQELLEGWGLPYEHETFSDLCICPIVSDKLISQVRRQAVDVDPLYIVFTSGSTGVPKGVVASHKSVIDYTESLENVLAAGPKTVFGMQSPLYLDACLKEIMLTLKLGATTHFVPPSLFMFPVKLVEFLNQKGINTICWVSSALGLIAGLGALDKAVPEALHTIAFTSEVLPVKHFNKWREVVPSARFVHLYGPTEATGVSTYYLPDRFFEEGESIPIGQPFPNTGIVLVDDNNQVPDVGQPGEIYIRGGRLSLGYFNDPDKTRAAFVQNPLSDFPDTVYKTGDLGYKDKNGNLYFISRRDHQIKHMGYRIELAEIEWVAARSALVELACAVFDGEKSRIILYYTGSLDTAAVKAYLKANLPRYMMPFAVFPLETLPLTPGGKLDRAGLLQTYKGGK